MQRHFQPDVHQLRPTLATLPNFAAELTKPAAPAVVLRYAAPDFVNQVRPTLAALPAPAGFELDFVAAKGQPQRYAPCDFSAPAKFGIVTAAITFLPGWSSTDGKPAVLLRYSPGDTWSGQVRPTLATLPILLDRIAEWPNHRVEFTYAKPDVAAQISPTLATLPILLDRIAEFPNRRIELVFASPDFVSQVRPTLATLPVLLAGLAEDSRKANPPWFSPAPSWSAPDKFAIVIAAATFLPGWSLTDGKPAVQLRYSPGDTWSNQVRPTLAKLPVLGWLDPNVFPAAKPPKFAAFDYSAAPIVQPAIAGVAQSIASLSAAVRKAIEAQTAAIRAAMEAMSAAVRPAIDSQNAAVRSL